jgi:hypothetical protein
MAKISTITDNISKEQFLEVYNSFPANAWTKFAFKYFSQSTLIKDKWLKFLAVSTLIVSFIMGFIGVVLPFKHAITASFVYLFSGIIVAIAVLMSGAAIMNNLRIRKIRKKLNINIYEYDALISTYLP